jgi:hypothetical protein
MRRSVDVRLAPPQEPVDEAGQFPRRGEYIYVGSDPARAAPVIGAEAVWLWRAPTRPPCATPPRLACRRCCVFFANRLITAFRYPGSQRSGRDELLPGGKPAQIGSILAQHNLHGLDANCIDLRHIYPAHSVQRLARRLLAPLAQASHLGLVLQRGSRLLAPLFKVSCCSAEAESRDHNRRCAARWHRTSADSGAD